MLKVKIWMVWLMSVWLTEMQKENWRGNWWHLQGALGWSTKASCKSILKVLITSITSSLKISYLYAMNALLIPNARLSISKITAITGLTSTKTSQKWMIPISKISHLSIIMWSNIAICDRFITVRLWKWLTLSISDI